MALSGIRQTFSNYLSPFKPSTNGHLGASSRTRHPDVLGDVDNFVANHNLDGDTLIDSATLTKKRLSSAKVAPESSRKRQKHNDSTYAPRSEDGDSDFDSAELETSTPSATIQRKPVQARQAADRVLMPPPATPGPRSRGGTPKRTPWSPGRVNFNLNDEELDVDEDETFTNQTAIKKGGPKEVIDFDQEKALRYAEATRLPETGGHWAEAEKDLFYRLAYRAFEPLIPSTWMNDFKTLPESLFALEGDPAPLIQANLQRDFRAIHELRNLFLLGQRVRDGVAERRKRAEPIFSRCLKNYVSWALTDVGLHPKQRPNAIPVHALVTMKRNETGSDTVHAISDKLYQLADAYTRAYGIVPSVETTDTESVITSATTDEANLPVLTGLMVCHSLVVIVTLNSASHARKQKSRTRRTSLQQATEDSGLRFIATFDFSDDGMDVWNALAIAIAVMRIRRTMLELCERGEANGEDGKGGLWERAVVMGDSRAEKGDPDA